MDARSRKLLVIVSVLLSCVISLGGPAAQAAPSSAGPVSFAHGVASGEVTPKSAVLWTRVDADVRTTDAEEDELGVLDVLLGAVGLP